MKDHPLRFFLDRVRAQGQEIVSVTLPPDFMDIHEEGLLFADSIVIEGEIYFAGEEVIVQLHAKTTVQMPCAICNEWVKLPLENRWTSVEPATSYRHGVIDLREMVRENLLIEMPLIAECEKGNCPARKEIKQFLSQKQKNQEEEAGFYPFADLKDPGE